MSWREKNMEEVEISVKLESEKECQEKRCSLSGKEGGEKTQFIQNPCSSALVTV